MVQQLTFDSVMQADLAKTNPFALRPYQEACIAKLVEYRKKGGKRGLIAMATGLGKTVLFAQIPKMAKKKVLVIAHREELLDQAEEKIRSVCPIPLPENIIEQADRHADPSSKVIIASIQTLAVSKGRLAALNPEDFSAVIIDEAHHSAAQSYVTVCQHLGLLPNVEGLNKEEAKAAFAEFKPADGAPFLLGVTATPSRTDGAGLEFVYDDIVFSMPIEEGIEQGYLVPLRGVRVESKADISNVQIRAGDFAEGKLSEVVNTPERNNIIVDGYLQHAKGRSALAFCVDVKHSEDVTETFRARGIQAELVVGATKKDDRKAIIDRFKQGDLPILVGCGVFLEGFDAPRTSALIMARPTKSSLIYTQMVGRGTRLADGKKDCLVIDYVDISRKASVQNLSTLFGLPPKLDLGGAEALATKKAFDPLGQQVPMHILEQAKSIDEVERLAKEFNPLAQATVDPWIKDITKYAWVKTGFGYALGVPHQGSIGIIENLLGKAEVVFKPQDGRKQQLGEYPALYRAFEAAEEWAVANHGEVMGMKSQDARWRHAPASDAQKQALRSGKVNFPEGLSKGEASDLLEKLHSEQDGLPATGRQLGFLKWKGYPIPGRGMTRAEAQKEIAKIMKGERGGPGA